jgi:hypothetical protein
MFKEELVDGALIKGPATYSLKGTRTSAVQGNMFSEPHHQDLGQFTLLSCIFIFIFLK